MLSPKTLLSPSALLNSIRRKAAHSLGQNYPTASLSKASSQPCAKKALKSKAVSPLEQQIHDRIETCYQEAEVYFKRSFIRPITQFTLRGKSAGTAHLQQNRLRFNPVLLKENSEAFLAEVVPHEICHLLCFTLYGKTKPHGREWQSLMRRVFKVNPKTTHSFNTETVTSNDVEYRCLCGPIRLSIRRHNKVMRGETRYLCKRCKTQLLRAESV
ncbi:SprT family zinc-dependent metalloprotease [Shewanella acanthi]|uniref:SprT family zinc-dependent metalloprotease n=1 Tax=Shewanella acanthi TaxID=2864212 RepID=UPI003D9C979E